MLDGGVNTHCKSRGRDPPWREASRERERLLMEEGRLPEDLLFLTLASEAGRSGAR